MPVLPKSGGSIVWRCRVSESVKGTNEAVAHTLIIKRKMAGHSASSDWERLLAGKIRKRESS